MRGPSEGEYNPRRQGQAPTYQQPEGEMLPIYLGPFGAQAWPPALTSEAKAAFQATNRTGKAVPAPLIRPSTSVIVVRAP